MSAANLTALLLTATGVGTLYLVHRPTDRSGLPVWIGWLQLLAAGWFWVRASGPEFGSVLALLVPALIAWAFIGANRRISERRPARAAARPDPATTVDVPGHLGRFVVAIPLAGSTALLTSVALALLLPTARVNAIAVAMAILPLLWATLSWWSVAAHPSWRPAASMVTAALAGVLTICFWPELAGAGR